MLHQFSRNSKALFSIMWTISYGISPILVNIYEKNWYIITYILNKMSATETIFTKFARQIYEIPIPTFMTIHQII